MYFRIIIYSTHAKCVESSFLILKAMVSSVMYELNTYKYYMHLSDTLVKYQPAMHKRWSVPLFPQCGTKLLESQRGTLNRALQEHAELVIAS